MGGLVNLLIPLGILFLIPIVPAIIYSEYQLVSAYAIPGAIVLVLGLLLRKKFPLSDNLSIVSAIMIASLGYLFLSAIGSLAFILTIGLSPIDAFFESINGFTTCGMTLFSDIESLPMSLLFWRSITQWVGGVGIILFFTLLLGAGGIGTFRLYTFDGRDEKLTPSVRTTIREIYKIFGLLTALCMVALYLLGMSPFDAVNHALTAVSTGGISTRTASIEAFQSPAIELALCIFMTCGAINFSLYYSFKNNGLKKIFKDAEMRILLGIIILCGGITSVALIITGYDLSPGIIKGYFNTICMISTAGYSSLDFMTLPESIKALFLILMVVGGCSGSTAGGMKIWRFLVLYKMTDNEVKKLAMPPITVRKIKIGGKVITEDYAIKVAAYFFVYIFAALLQFLILSLFIPDLFGALSLAISAQSNVGPAFYPVIGTNDAAKIVLIFGIWFGKLEFLPVLALLNRNLLRTLRQHT